MKKIISMMMVCILLLSCCAFASAESANSIVGEWYLSEIKLESGNTISPYDVMELTSLELNEGGLSYYKLNTYFAASDFECVWAESDGGYTLIIIEGETVYNMTYEVVDGVEYLTLMNGTRTDVFTREKPEGIERHTSPIARRVKPADFDGSWVGVAYLVYDQQLYYDTTTMMDIDLYYQIKDTYVTNFSIDHATGERAPDFYTAENAEFSTTDDVSMLITNATEYLALHDDGTLTVTVNDGNEILICRKLTDEEIAELPAPVEEVEEEVAE